MFMTRNKLLELLRTEGTIPDDLYNSTNENLRRIKVQAISLAQDYVTNAIGYTSSWYEQSIASNTSVYAEFTVPAGVYMALDYRLINTSSELSFYRVYPQGTYTAGADLTDSSTNFSRTRNLRQSAGVVSPKHLIRKAVTVLPGSEDFIVFVPVFGSVNSGNRASGNLSPDETFLLLSPNQKFLLEMRNEGATNQAMELVINYGFIPESQIPPLP